MKQRRRIVVSSFCPPESQERPSRPFQGAVKTQIRAWEERFASVWPDEPDLLVVPECCDRYKALAPELLLEYYQQRGQQVLEAFAAQARLHHCYIVYSAWLKDSGGTPRNASVLLDRQGKISGVYCKNHLMAGESARGIRCGDRTELFETDFGKVGMCICFDLNFRELLERYAVQEPNLMLFSSMYHGGLMQSYWAYRCNSYFVGAVAGVSASVLNPLGTEVAVSSNYFPSLTTSINLDYQLVHLDYNWEKLDALKQAYGRQVQIYDPGRLGSVLISSESESVDSKQMIEEFEIESWRDYYQRSLLDHQADHCPLPKNIVELAK